MRTLAPAFAALVLLAGCSAPAGSPTQEMPDTPAAEPAPAPLEVRAASPVKGYPLETCVVSGESLAMMGEPVAVEIDGTVVHLCCNHFVEDVKRDPAMYLSIVRAAMRSQSPSK